MQNIEDDDQLRLKKSKIHHTKNPEKTFTLDSEINRVRLDFEAEIKRIYFSKLDKINGIKTDGDSAVAVRSSKTSIAIVSTVHEGGQECEEANVVEH